MRKFLFLILFLFVSATSLKAQQWAVSTNALDYVNFGTINAEGAFAVSRHFCIDAGFKYNPWVFGDKASFVHQKFNKQRNIYIGAKYYPWFVFDGWFIGAFAGWREYAVSGVIPERAEEGDAIGAGVGFGYSLILHKSLNIDFGAYLWGGSKTFNAYSCSSCGRLIESGKKGFIAPANIQVSLTWVFGERRDRKRNDVSEQVNYEVR